MSDCIGELLEEPNEVRTRVSWLIPGFFSLDVEKGSCIQSPVFFSENAACHLAIYPKGVPDDGYSENLVVVQLCRVDSGPPKKVILKVKLENVSEELTHSYETRRTLSKKNIPCCYIEKSYLLQRQYTVAPFNVLSINCSLVECHSKSMDDSLLRRLWNLCLHWKSVFSSRENTDLTLKLKDGVAKAHRLVLSSRSPVFDRMFSLDMRERQTGEVYIEDVDAGPFSVVLAYIYSGDPLGLSPENALDVYKASHKYALHDLITCCTEYIVASLTTESVCDVITTASLYVDERLMGGAITYFRANRKDILSTNHWKTLKKNNPEIACEALECSLLEGFGGAHGGGRT